MKRKQPNNTKRFLRHCRYGIWQRNKDLDWAEPYHQGLCGIALIFVIIVFLVYILRYCFFG